VVAQQQEKVADQAAAEGSCLSWYTANPASEFYLIVVDHSFFVNNK